MTITRVYEIAPEELKLVVSNLTAHPNYRKICELKKISMLHEEVLLLLYMFAATGPGGILEIGAYIGGSTIALASGTRDGSARKFISIEMGGDNPAHELATDDIFRDLCANVRSWGVSEYVTLIHGRSDSKTAIEEVYSGFRGQGIGLLFIDADGLIERDLANYRSLLLPGSIIVLDDYSMPKMVIRDPNPEKNRLVRSAVDSAMRQGLAEPLGVFGWGTWFGRYCG